MDKVYLLINLYILHNKKRNGIEQLLFTFGSFVSKVTAL